MVILDKDANQTKISIEHILKNGCDNICCDDCPIDLNIDNEATLCNAITNIHSVKMWGGMMEIMIKVNINGSDPIEVADILVHRLTELQRVDKAFVVHSDAYDWYTYAIDN